MSKPVKATPVRGLPRRTKALRPGRLCAQPDCDTILSVYNKSDACYAHMGNKRPRLPR